MSPALGNSIALWSPRVVYRSSFDLAQGYFARGIARRLKQMGLPMSDQRELDAGSHAFAGNLLSLLKWWLDRGAKEPAKDMDDLFHRMVWKGLR